MVAVLGDYFSCLASHLQRELAPRTYWNGLYLTPAQTGDQRYGHDPRTLVHALFNALKSLAEPA